VGSIHISTRRRVDVNPRLRLFIRDTYSAQSFDLIPHSGIDESPEEENATCFSTNVNYFKYIIVTLTRHDTGDASANSHRVICQTFQFATGTTVDFEEL
jgi:hypothetical protein